jgi:large subunit ribosomal protein L40e
MSSLVSLTQQSTLNVETATMFLQMGIFSRYHPFFREFFQTLKNIKDASDVILFVSQLTISMREKILELFGQTGIQIPEEQLRLFMETPIESFESLTIWNDYFRNTLNEEQRGKYRKTYQNQFIPLEELISFSKSFYSSEIFGIYVKSLTGRSIYIEITHQMSIEELKMKIQEKDGTPVEQQRFIFAGKDFKDSMLLGMYNITKDSTIHLVLRLRGGMHHITSTGILRKDFESLREELSPKIQKLFEEIFYE